MAYIYAIKNKVNEKIYIGQTKNSLEYRFEKHKAQRNCKSQCSALYSAFRKYGTDKFWIEEVESGDFSEEELNNKEIYYIQKFNSISPNGYNLQFGGKCSGMADETKLKLSQKLKGRQITWGDKVSKSMKELWKDPVYRERMVKAHSHPIGKYKKHKKPLRRKLPIEEINELYKNGMNINQIAKKYGVHFSLIKRRIGYGD